MSSLASDVFSFPRVRLLYVGLIATIPVSIAIARLPPQLVLAGLVAVLFVLAALRWPIIVGVAVVASVPVQQVGAVGPLTVTRAMVILAIGVTVLAVLAQRRDLVLSWLLLPLGAYIAWMSVSATQARDTVLATDEVLRWAITLTALFIMLQLFVTAPRLAVIAVVTAIGVVAALQALTGVLQGLLSIGPESFNIGGQFSRAYGTFGRPNTFAGYLEMALFPVLWVGFLQLRVTWRTLARYRIARLQGFTGSVAERRELLRDGLILVLLVGSTGTIALGILSSFSRGAWLGVAFGLLVSAAFAFRRWWIPIAAAMPVVALLALVLMSSLSAGVVSERLLSITSDARPFDAASITITDENFAVVERMAHWQAGWNMFRDRPIFGVGPGNFNAEYSDYFVRTQFRFSQGHAHNYYIHALAETGIVGLMLYVSMMIAALGLAVRVALRSAGLALALALGAIGTTAAVMAHNVFENLHVLNLGIQLTATWALVIAAHRMPQREAEELTLGTEQYSH